MAVVLGDLLDEGSIVLDASADSREDAIRQAGERLVAAGAARGEYLDAMFAREYAVSTYIGEGVAVPHGTLHSKETVLRDAIVLLRFADAVDWDGDEVTIVIGIAARGRGYIGLLSRLATILLDPDNAQSLRDANSPAEVYAILGKN